MYRFRWKGIRLKLPERCVIVGFNAASKGMGTGLKRTIAAVLVLILGICMITASASPAGSTEAPLVSRSYLNNQFAASMRTEITNVLGDATDKSIGRLNEIYRERIGYSYTPGFMPVLISQGGTVALTTGASFILTSGEATLTVSSGEVINVSTGNAAVSGSKMAANQRYFCTEDTSMRITTGTAATGLIDGYYFAEGSVTAIRPLPFTDVPANAWFFPAVDFVFRSEYFAGTATTTFSPGTSMTRGMFVTVLHRLDGKPAVGSGGGFSDVTNPAAFFYNAVAWANANGIVKGYEDGTFQPNKSVTREEMAVIMHRYATFKGRDMSAPGDVFKTFPDVGKVSAFAADAMRWAVSWEIIRGSEGSLLPQNTATRAEVAQIIFNYCEKMK